jgi:putative spermidine/putrescine transport system substrate-binding protein
MAVRTHALRSLTVLTFAGRIAQTQKKVLFAPYSRLSGHPLRCKVWNGEPRTLRQQEEHAPHSLAAVMMECSGLQIACGMGLLMKETDGHNQTVCSTPSAAIDYAMAWDRFRFDVPPGWADFWDVARHPGRRSLRRDPRTTLEIALLADGIPADALYRALASHDGLNRAFMKLDQIRPYIAWWSTPEEAGQILLSGGALMGLVPTGEILGAQSDSGDKFGIRWQQRLQVQYGWGVPRHAAHSNACLALTSWLEQPAQKQAFANAWPSLPSMQDIAAAGGALSPLPPATVVNDSFWSQNFSTIAERFHRWAARP